MASFLSSSYPSFSYWQFDSIIHQLNNTQSNVVIFVQNNVTPPIPHVNTLAYMCSYNMKPLATNTTKPTQNFSS